MSGAQFDSTTDASRRSAPGVRIPHQNRSWPSTRSTIALGNAADSSRTWSSWKSYGSLGLWTLPQALIAAPLFEEFIFRGLIFGGLRRSFGVWPAALASAAIFAIVHPAFSIIPVFLVGVCAALVYERSRSLLAPMIVHAVYNGCVIGAQTYFL